MQVVDTRTPEDRYDSLFETSAFFLEFIEKLKFLAIVNPDVSQTVQKIVMLCNNGHELDIEAKNERAADAAIEQLNDLAKNGFTHAAGLDGFINQQIRQIIITGALCQESVPEMNLSGIEKVSLIKTSRVRFRKIDGKYTAVVRRPFVEVVMNPETFSYIPLFLEEENPYAIPPFMAALKMLDRQKDQWEDIDSFTSRIGAMGITHLKTDVPREHSEADKDYQRRAEKYLNELYKQFLKGAKKGIAVTDKQTELTHYNTTTASGALDKLITATEQQVASGLDIDPAMLGRTYSTTETYATVCYETLLNKNENIRRIIKRANERPYNLHLVMKKIPASCSIIFNDAPSLRVKEKVESEQIRQNMILTRLEKGIIDEDTAARELGYDQAAGVANKQSEEKENFCFAFNRQKNKYEFSRNRVILSKKKTTRQ